VLAPCIPQQQSLPISRFTTLVSGLPLPGPTET